MNVVIDIGKQQIVINISTIMVAIDNDLSKIILAKTFNFMLF